MSVLRGLGFAVERVGSARGARAAWRPGLFSLVVADVQIPESETDGSQASGLDVVAWMRDRGEAARVVVWSCDASEEQRERARCLGAAFVAKDVSAAGRLHEELS